MKSLSQIAESLLLSSDFDQDIIDVVNQYVNTNNKGLIVTIDELINKNPILRDLRNSYGSAIETCYRGLCLDNPMSDDRIIGNELKNRYVACSTDREVAMNYAMGDSVAFNNTTDQNHPILLSYTPIKENVIFDTNMFKEIIEGEFTPEIILDVKANGFNLRPQVQTL